MPLKTWNTKADFDAAYDIRVDRGGRPGGTARQMAHYERRALFNEGVPRLNFVKVRWDGMLAAWPWPLTAKILVLGCGFGWGVEYLEALGYTDVWGVDTSLYIQGAKDEVDPADGQPRSKNSAKVRPENVNNTGERNKLIRETIGQGATFDVVVTESLLESLTDAECVQGSQLIHDHLLVPTTGQLVHLVVPLSVIPDSQDAGYNWKTLADWKLLLPADDFIDPVGNLA